VRRLTADGINVNVTLLFSIDAHARVIEAYISGLEDRLAAGKPIDRLASVASFFVSRVDSELDKRLDAVAASASEGCATGSSPFAGARPWPTRSSPTVCSRRGSPASDGRRWRQPARECSVRCGRARAPRTPPIATCSTSRR